MARQNKDEEFDYRPIVPGASVPLRRQVDRVSPDGSREGRTEFKVASGEGEIDGVKFSVYGSIGCNLVVVFRRGKDDGWRDHTYEVSARDVITAAYAVDKAIEE